MKKLLTVLIAFSMLISLSACQKSKETSTSTTVQQASNNQNIPNGEKPSNFDFDDQFDMTNMSIIEEINLENKTITVSSFAGMRQIFNRGENFDGPPSQGNQKFEKPEDMPDFNKEDYNPQDMPNKDDMPSFDNMPEKDEITKESKTYNILDSTIIVDTNGYEGTLEQLYENATVSLVLDGDNVEKLTLIVMDRPNSK